MMIEFRGDHGTVATVDIGAPTPAGTAAMAEVLAIFEIIPGSGDKPWAELRCRRCSPLWASVHTPTGPDGRELALFITAPSTLDELVQAALDHARSIDHEEN